EPGHDLEGTEAGSRREAHCGSPRIRCAVEAVRRWRYKPTRLNGVPVAVLLTVKVRFDLSM
ncbi:MAG TPA: energy transducer TonB, partial [Vicinamibacteria bacterium]